MEFIVERLVTDVRDRQAKLILVYIPVMTEVKPLPPEFAPALSRWVDDRNVFVVDTTNVIDTFVEENDADLLRAGGVDSHPSEVAHQMIADEIAPVIDRILASPD